MFSRHDMLNWGLGELWSSGLSGKGSLDQNPRHYLLAAWVRWVSQPTLTLKQLDESALSQRRRAQDRWIRQVPSLERMLKTQN